MFLPCFMLRIVGTRRCTITTAFVFDIKENLGKPGGLNIKWYTSASGLC
jgi:hypothetical protein